MQYISTRDASLSVSASRAIASGISVEGGLFVPAAIPAVTKDWIEQLATLEYPQRAVKVLELFLTDYSVRELEEAVDDAYSDGVFEEDWAAPLSDLSDGRYILELWHGPTCAFKDMALQLLPHLLVDAARRELGGRQVMILVATSGDTGKAALEGFQDVEGVKLAVFYPDQGVSPMQRLQMTTQQGENVAVYAIEGNFDNAQTQVKKIFTDRETIDLLARENTVLSSANSINWGRLVPQVVYYFSAYADLVGCGDIEMGDQVNFVVPTGNFGNILAGYYARRMGLPINKLICASNRNNVLTDFIREGIYDANREFYTTLSPSMDILISSNLERLLFELTGRNSEKVAEMMRQLTQNRRYVIDEALHGALCEAFWGGSLDDEGCKEKIKETFDTLGYLVDPHTAVAMGVYDQYKEETGDGTPTVILSTASPYKFARSVLDALGERQPEDEFAAVAQLARTTATQPPDSISALRTAKIRFTRVVAPEEMPQTVVAFAAGVE